MPAKLQIAGLRLDGASRAGDSTWLRVQPPGLAFDVGRGTPRLGGVRWAFLTHGHMDHALGLPYLLSMRAGSKADPLQIFCPAPIEGAVRELLEAAARLDQRHFAYRLTGLVPGDRVEVAPDLEVEPFATDHVVAGLGYHLVRTRRRLREELRDAGAERIVQLRRAGESIDEVVEERWLSCTGDTSAAVFESTPELFESRVLVVECTFLDPEHRGRAQRFKHIHLDELVALREHFANEALVLYHLSRRHRPSDLVQAVRERLQPITPEVHVVG